MSAKTTTVDVMGFNVLKQKQKEDNSLSRRPSLREGTSSRTFVGISIVVLFVGLPRRGELDRLFV